METQEERRDRAEPPTATLPAPPGFTKDLHLTEPPTATLPGPPGFTKGLHLTEPPTATLPVPPGFTFTFTKALHLTPEPPPLKRDCTDEPGAPPTQYVNPSTQYITL